MTWVSFVGFWQMRELGQEDAVFRNYDLLWNTGKSTEPGNEKPLHLWLALKRSGLMEHGDTYSHIPWAVAEAAQRLVNLGMARPTNPQLVLRLVAWFNWDRIRCGEYQQFMLRSKSVAKERTGR